MKRALLIVAVAAVVVAVTGAAAIRSRTRLQPDTWPDARPAEVAAELRAEESFTTRPNSPVGRTLVQVLAIRRIGRGSCEVEFTWRDTAPVAGQAVAPLHTSLALFRLQTDRQWRLTTLFRVD